jgi:glycosyltransferase involved in cell wall biosynthesis
MIGQMKVLLLTDCLPCKNLTGGLFLNQLCRFLPAGTLVCFAVTNPDIPMEMSPDLPSVPVERVPKPREAGNWENEEPALGLEELECRATAKETERRLLHVPALIEKAVSFARRHSVDAVWAVLEGQTMTHMALPVANALDVPLFCLVWDPIEWWLRAHKVDKVNAGLAIAQFSKTVRHSKACAVASWAMAEEYQRRFGVRSIPLVATHPAAAGLVPSPTLRTHDELVIGMAGQFYAMEEWHSLLGALEESNWRIAGREVKLKVLGHYVPDSKVPPNRLQFLGWKPQTEAIEILSGETDVLYCPYPFSEDMKDVARLSFPSKIALYFAAGRPVIFHGPAYAGPGRYMAERRIGVVSTVLNAQALVKTLGDLVASPTRYAEAARSSQRAFRLDFTEHSMKAAFFAFLDLPSGDGK